ncbi:hypothetical protein QQS21_006590 [Conoideocrella luteorostrata]|uniref:CCHC-type domain-containing protein n=1 Tax=Conoideocrella luteorostrata TaxID=1105319 RepID=A0AAJ0CMG4_9HYPO|nr:hypothetical protein QQS21_006590 [Conoideocrella luteorostrata]
MAPETPKGISSRLLTMKFMQRAAASASSNVSPDSEAPSSKKRKLEQSPASGRINPNIDQALIQAALDDQEATRQAALEKHSATDTHWVINTNFGKHQRENQSRPLNVVYVGYGDFDSEADEDNPAEGRTYTKIVKQNSDGRQTSDPNESSQNSADDSDTASHKHKSRSSNASTKNPGIVDRSRSQSRSKQDSESVLAKEFREKRRKKEIRLNNLSSISSAGDGQFGSQGSPDTKAMKCYNCQQVGHKASDCSKPKKRNTGHKS